IRPSFSSLVLCALQSPQATCGVARTCAPPRTPSAPSARTARGARVAKAGPAEAGAPVERAHVPRGRRRRPRGHRAVPTGAAAPSTHRTCVRRRSLYGLRHIFEPLQLVEAERAGNTKAAQARGSRRPCPLGPHLVIRTLFGPRPTRLRHRVGEA